jgi:hypothetical protein
VKVPNSTHATKNQDISDIRILKGWHAGGVSKIKVIERQIAGHERRLLRYHDDVENTVLESYY